MVRVGVIFGAPVRQPGSKQKQLEPTEDCRHNPELNHVSLWNFEDMEENLGHGHHDQNLPETQILSKKSQTPSEKVVTSFGLIMKVGVRGGANVGMMSGMLGHQLVEGKRCVKTSGNPAKPPVQKWIPRAGRPVAGVVGHNEYPAVQKLNPKNQPDGCR